MPLLLLHRHSSCPGSCRLEDNDGFDDTDNDDENDEMETTTTMTMSKISEGGRLNFGNSVIAMLSRRKKKWTAMST